VVQHPASKPLSGTWPGVAAVLDAPGAAAPHSPRESDYEGPSRAVHNYLKSVGQTDMLYHQQQRQDPRTRKNQATWPAAAAGGPAPPKKGLKAKVQRLLAKCE
jgi:hypothetical protein